MLGLLFYLLFQHNDPSIYGKTIFSAIYELTLMKSQSDNFIWRCSPWFPRVQCNSVAVEQYRCWPLLTPGPSGVQCQQPRSAAQPPAGRVLVVAISEMRGSHPQHQHSHITRTLAHHGMISPSHHDMISLPHHDITIHYIML